MIQTLHLFRPLNDKLIEVLSAIQPTDWGKQTVARMWTVKDVAAHLLDGNVRTISIYRDQTEVHPDTVVSNYRDLVTYLDRLNADWISAMKRVSDAMLLQWLRDTHEEYINCLERLNPDATAKYGVSWAGQKVSPNWFHIAREYTEKWHHQQQIRTAIDQPGIMTKEFYRPALDIFFQALPFQYRNIKAESGTQILLEVDSDGGGSWGLRREGDAWIMLDSISGDFNVKVSIPADIAWLLLTKAKRYEEVSSS